MNSKWLYGLFAAHFGLSFGAWLGLNGAAVAAQDAGTTATALAWLRLPVNFVLLQPLAYWVLAAAEMQWWTWTGLAGASVLIALNSLLFVALVSLWRRAWRRPA